MMIKFEIVKTHILFFFFSKYRWGHRESVINEQPKGGGPVKEPQFSLALKIRKQNVFSQVFCALLYVKHLFS